MKNHTVLRILSLVVLVFSCSTRLSGQNARLWSTYYGSSGAESGSGATTATDPSGNVYVLGNTTSTLGIATAGAHQSTYGGGSYDCYLVKFDANGNRLWATYYGGSGFEYGYHVACDASGNVYIAGHTSSATQIASGGYDNTIDGPSDAFLVKFNGNGVRQWGTYYGGPSEEHFYHMAIDNLGNIYAVGFTFSASGIATVGAHQTTYGGTVDGILVKFNASGALQWGTYYGGTNDDNSYGVAVDASGNVFMTGSASSSSGIASGGFQNTLQGTYDVFIAKFNASGMRQWASYFGGPAVDNPSGFNVATDPSGNVFFSGLTASSAGVATSGSHQSVYGGGANDGFVAKVSAAGSLLWATYYGGAGDDACTGLCSDPLGHVYVTGRTNSASGIAFSGYLLSAMGGNDGFLVRFDGAGNRIVSTYYGGVSNEGFNMPARDLNGKIYAVGVTTSSSNIAAGGYQTTYGGGDDAYLVKFDAQCLVPAQPAAITGLNSICSGAAGTYSIAAVAAATSYTWTLPGSWSGSSTTTSIATTASATSGSVSVVANNACGASTPRTLTVSVGVAPSQPVAIAGSATVCIGSSNTYSVVNDPNATSYTWTLPGGWSGTSTTNSISTTAGALGGTLSVVANNACGTSSAQALTIAVISTPAQPAAISGNASVCVGSSNTYGVVNDPNATSYTWTLPGGWSGTSTTNSISTTAGVSGGTVSVVANNSCGTSAPRTLTVSVGAAPSQPAAISGNASVCVGSSNTYSVVNDPNATSYTWTLPGGWSGTSTTNSITATAGAVGGALTVVANNSCGTSTSQTLNIAVNATPAQPAAISGNASVCVGSSNTYSVTNDPNATSYTWTLPGGWSGTSTTNSITTTAGVSGGTVSVVANNSCGTSTSQTLNIAVNATPAQPAAISGNASVCAGSSNTYSVLSDPNATSYTWTLPGGWSGTSSSNTITATVGTTGGDISVVANNGCGTSAPSALFPVTVQLSPVANYTILSNVNPVSFSDLSTNSPSQWAWDFGDLSSSTVQNPTHIYANPGSYTVCLTVTNGCGSDTTCQNLDVLVGIEPRMADFALTVFPNPSNGTFTVQASEPGSFQLVNSVGQVLRAIELDGTQDVVVRMESLPAGIYHLRRLGDVGGMGKVIVVER